jgi:hypothetical protein
MGKITLKQYRETVEGQRLYRLADHVLKLTDKGYSLKGNVAKGKLLLIVRNKMQYYPPEERMNQLSKAFKNAVGVLDYVLVEEYMKGAEVGDLMKKYNYPPWYIRGVLRLVGLYNNRVPYIADKIWFSYRHTRSIMQTAENLKISPTLVKMALKLKGIKAVSKNMLKKKAMLSLKQPIIDDYNSGMTSEAVAKKYGFDPTTVEKYLKKWNIKLRGFPHKLPPASEVANMLREEGVKYEDVARKYGADRAAVIDRKSVV